MKLVQHRFAGGPLDGRFFAVAGRLLLLFLLVPACNDDRALAAARGVSAGETAADREVTEYCNRQATCGAIPASEEEACVARLRNGVLAEYDNAACNERVSERELARCIQAIHNGDCGNPLDSLSQLDACRARRVCRPRR